MKTFGIDISFYQKGLDLAKAKAEGVKYVIIKCSQSNYTDSQFENHYANAKKNGLGVGAYHYLTSTTKAGAINEAKYAINGPLKGKQFDYPIFVDVEDAPIKDLGKAAVTEIVTAFCTELEKAGYWGGLYTNWDWYNHYMDGPELAKRFSLWLAFWGLEMPQCEAQMWQFGGSTNFIRSNRIAGQVCDQDYALVDFPSIIKAKGLNGYTKNGTSKPTTPAKKTIDQIADEVIAGKWGVGADRKKKLTAAGYDYDAVQRRVDEKCGATKKPTALKVGDKVRLQKNAPVWGQNYPFLPFVYNEDLYITELNGDRAVISLRPNGPTTGAVDKKYLTNA